MAARETTMKLLAAAATLGMALLAPQSVAAQPTVPAWRDLVIYAADASYPKTLAERGVQGDVTVELTLDPNGRARGATVRESSRSAELDKLAVEIARRLEIGADGSASGPRVGLVNIRFRKDHDSTIAGKTCADFNADAAYQTATFPERSMRELPVFYEGIGKLVYGFHREGERRAFPSVDAVLDATVAGCARAPQSGMLDVMRQETLKLLQK